MYYSLFFDATLRRKQTRNRATTITPSKLGKQVLTITVYGTLAAITLLAYFS
jgi:hypothetical protein